MSVTFAQNIGELLSLKKEAQSLLQLYSKDVFNFNHVDNLQQKTHQLKSLLHEMGELKVKNEYEKELYEEKIEGLQAEMGRVQKKNQDLVQKQQELEENQHALEQELIEKDRECEELKKEKETVAQKYMREMENLKLMYTQELYIAKRFDKSGK